jgi:hypothetical protein
VRLLNAATGLLVAWVKDLKGTWPNQHRSKTEPRQDVFADVADLTATYDTFQNGGLWHSVRQ